MPPVDMTIHEIADQVLLDHCCGIDDSRVRFQDYAKQNFKLQGCMHAGSTPSAASDSPFAAPLHGAWQLRAAQKVRWPVSEHWPASPSRSEWGLSHP